MQKRLIRVAHSPDSDDAFMFYALAKDKIDTGEFRFDHVLSDIQTLNQEALKGTYEVSAISFHAFPQVAARYALLPSGSSMGDRYGPMVIAREAHAPSVLRERKVAVPGLMTTVFLGSVALRAEHRLRRDALQRDSLTGRCRGEGRSGPDHPRGGSHLRAERPAQDRRSKASGGSRRPAARRCLWAATWCARIWAMKNCIHQDQRHPPQGDIQWLPSITVPRPPEHALSFAPGAWTLIRSPTASSGCNVNS